jgi:hypothetical protein
VIPKKEFSCYINGKAWDHSKKPVIPWDQSVILAKALSPDERCKAEVGLLQSFPGGPAGPGTIAAVLGAPKACLKHVAKRTFGLANLTFPQLQSAFSLVRRANR